MAEGFAFDENAVKRILRAVHYVEQQYQGGAPMQGGFQGPLPMPPFRVGKTRAAVGAAATVTVDEQTTDDGTSWIATGEEQEVTTLNIPGISIPSGGIVLFSYHARSQRWLIIGWQCP